MGRDLPNPVGPAAGFDRNGALVGELSAFPGPLPLLAVGGIAAADDARERPRAGATLVQVDIGLVREGSFLVRRMAGGLRNRCAAPLREGAAA